MYDKTCTVSLATILMVLASCSRVCPATETTSQPVSQQTLAKMPV
jgi:hypothetical protein